ncbi:MAG TPA: ATP-binding protein [Ktedonobacteraceae bacterium]|nr:ATP-binding protein [Ktedonobacteraceae bacterium]
MSLQAFLDPVHLLQTVVLALSIFDLTAFLWLTFTVWLNGDRRAGIVRLGVAGLGLSALFFFIHALLISSPLISRSSSLLLDFWWRMIWIPALGVPYIWFAIGLHYAALINARWRRRRPFLLIIGSLPGLAVLLLLILNRDTFTYVGALRLLSYNETSGASRSNILSPPMLIPVLFLVYVTFCAIGPWFTSGRISRLCKILWRALLPGRRAHTQGQRVSLGRELLEAFWDDPADVELLEEPQLSWHLARPGLLLAALLMVGLTTTLGVLVAQSMLNWLGYGAHPPELSSQTSLPSGASVPFNLLILDLLATGAVALVILLIGYSIVRHGVLIERPLARRGFFEQWRGIVIVSTLLAILISLLVALTRSSLGGLLLIASLATGVYALFTWSSYTAHDRYVALLGPFVRSTSARHWLNTDLPRTEQELEHLFFHLCHDVLAVQCAYLSALAGTVRRSFSYRWPADLLPGPEWSKSPRSNEQRIPRTPGSEPKTALYGVPRRIQVYTNEQPMIIWVLPIYNERGPGATLYLGPRADGSAFTDEDMNLAHACGQRILDTLGDHEAMQAVTGLLRRRIVDVKLLGAQQRRVLHDEILPQMHLALLHLEMLRSTSDNSQLAPDMAVHVERRRATDGMTEIHTVGKPDEASTIGLEKNLAERGIEARKQAVDEAIEIISATHRRLAAMMRATAPGAPHRLEHEGLINAILTMLEQDFQHAFDEVVWEVSEGTAASIDEVISPAIAELIFAAVQEALRNAARHARGADIHRHLRLSLKATWNPRDPNLEVLIADNGVGISATSSTTGTGGGLLTHSALLAIAGGSLTINSTPGEGVTVRILLPTETLC